MSGLLETLEEPVDAKEDKEFDVQTEDNFCDEYFDPTRYIFYR